MATNYHLPSNYIENPPLTFSEHPRDYWTEARIKSSHEFQYHVYEYAGQLFKKNRMESLLDIGAGPGTKIPFFFDMKKIKLDLIDQPGMEEITNKACPNSGFFGANLEKDDVDTGKKYDMIICSDVIEHLGKPDNLLEIIKNHLKKEGLAIISTPDREMRRGKENKQSPNAAHVREWSSTELSTYLSESGLDIVHQLNYPLKRISPLKQWLGQNLLYRKIKKNDWFACQLLVVRT